MLHGTPSLESTRLQVRKPPPASAQSLAQGVFHLRKSSEGMGPFLDAVASTNFLLSFQISITINTNKDELMSGWPSD